MNPRIVIRPRADFDVDEHAMHIAQDSLAAARRFLEAVQRAYQKLASMPELGGSCEFQNTSAADVRVWPIRRFKNHLIFYRPIDGGVEIVRVLHGSRDYQAMFEAPS